MGANGFDGGTRRAPGGPRFDPERVHQNVTVDRAIEASRYVPEIPLRVEPVPHYVPKPTKRKPLDLDDMCRALFGSLPKLR